MYLVFGLVVSVLLRLQLTEAAGCRCDASGDPHFISYDNALIDFFGQCKYTLSKSTFPKGKDGCAFNVEIKNERRFGIELSFPRMIDLYLLNGVFKVRLLQEKVVQINGRAINIPFKYGTKLEIIDMEDGNLKVESPDCGISAFWNGYDEFILEVPDRYKKHMTGLCGDCDGNADNDIKTSKGAILANTPENFVNVGKSYEVPDDSDKQSPKSCVAPIPPKPKPCAPSEALRSAFAGSSFCRKILTSFQATCGDKTNKKNKVVDIYESCIVDLCTMHKAKSKNIEIREALCDMMEETYVTCSTNGKKVKNYRTTDFCPLDCKHSKEKYFPKVKICEATCDDPQMKTCSTADKQTEVDGCRCMAGYLRHKENCYLPTKCPLPTCQISEEIKGRTCVPRCKQAEGKIFNYKTKSGCKDICDKSEGLVFNLKVAGMCESKCKPAGKIWSKEHKDCILECNYADKGMKWNQELQICKDECDHVNTGKEWNKKNKKCEETCKKGQEWDVRLQTCTAICDKNKGLERTKSLKECKLICNPAWSLVWNIQKRKCVDACKKEEKYNDKTKKCDIRCKKSEGLKYDSVSNECSSICTSKEVFENGHCERIVKCKKEKNEEYDPTTDTCKEFCMKARGLKLNAAKTHCEPLCSKTRNEEFSKKLSKCIPMCDEKKGRKFDGKNGCESVCKDKKVWKGGSCILICMPPAKNINGKCEVKKEPKTTPRPVQTPNPTKGKPTKKPKKPSSVKPGTSSQEIVVPPDVSPTIIVPPKKFEEHPGKDCICEVADDPHVTTFDGVGLDYQGQCKYLVTELAVNAECKFSVEVKFDMMFGIKGVTFPREVDVKVNGATIRMLGEEYMYQLKGKKQTKFGEKINGSERQDKNRFWKVAPSANGLVVDAWNKCGFKVDYDGAFLVSITVTNKYSGKLQGLCGNCNGKKRDDWTTKSKEVLTIDPIGQRTVTLGDSWLVKDDSSKPSSACKTPPKTPVKCKDTLKGKLTSGISQCGRLKTDIFKACRNKLSNFDEYIHNCNYDACSMYNSNPKIEPKIVIADVCSTLSEVATLCISKNVAVKGWRHGLCPAKCGPNMDYKDTVVECMNTCNEPKADQHCSIGKTEGCVCKPGFVFNDGKCIDPKTCPK